MRLFQQERLTSSTRLLNLPSEDCGDVLRVSARTPADYLLFGVTAAELVALFLLTPDFTAVDWVYLSQHLLVLGIALMRRAPETLDRSLPAGIAVIVAYAYPYAQMVYLARVPGITAWPTAGLVLVVVASCLSLAGLFTLGRWFGNRPALRGLATTGPYRLVRHPMYLSYVLADIGYNLREWNVGTVLLVLIGWAALVYRIRAEERVLSQDPGWLRFRDRVRSRLIPGLW
jgi:protein-S-isoprenylcysteine O-methyltransferase Ste14